MQRLVLQDSAGNTLRTFDFRKGEAAHLIIRKDTRRLEVVRNLDYFIEEDISFEKLSDIFDSSPVSIDVKGVGKLCFVENIDKTEKNIEVDREDGRAWRLSLLSILVLTICGGFLISLLRPVQEEAKPEPFEQHVVKVVKKKVEPTSSNVSSMPSTTRSKTVQKTVQRMGALAVLGRFNKGSNKGGLNLGAAQTSPGPGLGGGTQGSGGVQTSLYGKGIIGAPVGAGGNIKGAGGYGTKGKGGGQDGYGQLSLVGSSGTADISIGSESIVEGGLDQSLIAQVIQRNMGQIRFCYEQGLQSNPSLSGRVAVDFTIGANGQVAAAAIKSTTLNAASVENCILLRLKTWKFPLPENGVNVKVSYPFLLKRLGSS